MQSGPPTEASGQAVGTEAGQIPDSAFPANREVILDEAMVASVREGIWINPGKNTETVMLSENQVVWSNGENTSPPHGMYSFQGDWLMLCFHYRGSHELVKGFEFQIVAGLDGVYRFVPDLTIICIFNQVIQALRCEPPLQVAIEQVKLEFGIDSAFLWMHPKKQPAFVFLTRTKQVIYTTKDGTLGPCNGNYDWWGPTNLRLHFHSDGAAANAQTTYMRRMGEGSAVFRRVDGYAHDYHIVSTGDSGRWRYKNYDIVAIQVLV